MSSSTEAAHLLRTAPPMVVLRPGDKVLIAFTDDPPHDVTQEIAASLRSSFRGVDFTVLTGVSSVAVCPGEVTWWHAQHGSGPASPASGGS